jgi:DNA-directed RNA polymerase specialized sigma24 family protein
MRMDHNPEFVLLGTDSPNMNGLSEALRAPFRLRYLAGLSYSAISKRLSLPPGTVRSRLYCARLQIIAARSATTFTSETIHEH